MQVLPGSYFGKCADTRVIRAILEGHRDLAVVAEAGHGRDAVLLYREPLPDAAMLDVRMPELDGLGRIREIRSFDPNARIVVLRQCGSACSAA